MKAQRRISLGMFSLRCSSRSCILYFASPQRERELGVLTLCCVRSPPLGSRQHSSTGRSHTLGKFCSLNSQAVWDFCGWGQKGGEHVTWMVHLAPLNLVREKCCFRGGNSNTISS